MTPAGDLDLTRFIRPGDTVLVEQSTGEPRALVEALIAQRHELAPLTVFIGSSYTGLLRPEHADALRFVGFGAVGRTGALVQAGVVELHPVHFGAVPGLITSGRIPIDVVLAQVSPPGPDGTPLARPRRRLRRPGDRRRPHDARRAQPARAVHVRRHRRGRRSGSRSWSRTTAR